MSSKHKKMMLIYSLAIFLIGLLFNIVILKQNIFKLNINNFIFLLMMFISAVFIHIRISNDCNILEEILRMNKEINETQGEIKEIIENFSDKNKYKKIYMIWNAFKKTLYIKNNIYYQTIDIEEYYNTDSLLKEKMNYKLCNYIPQLLLGLGMFGTFLGLSLGLEHVDLVSGDKSQLMSLIDGTKTAFYTSLYGMYFSISISCLLNFHFGYYEQKIIELKDKLNKFFIKYVNVDCFENMLIEMKNIRNINQQLVKNIKDELIEGIEKYNENNKKHLETLTTLVEANISGLADNVSKAFEEKLEKVFSNEFLRSFDTLKESLLKITEENNDQMRTVLVGMENVSENLDKIINNFNKFSTVTMSNFTDMMDRLENKYEDVINILAENNIIYEKYTELLNNSRDIIVSSDRYVKELKDISIMLNNVIEKDKSLVDFWSENKNIMSNLTSRLDEFYVSYNEKINEQNMRLDTYYNKHLKELFTEYDTNITKAILEFEKILVNFTEKAYNLNDTLEKTLIEKYKKNNVLSREKRKINEKEK